MNFLTNTWFQWFCAFSLLGFTTTAHSEWHYNHYQDPFTEQNMYSAIGVSNDYQYDYGTVIFCSPSPKTRGQLWFLGFAAQTHFIEPSKLMVKIDDEATISIALDENNWGYQRSKLKRISINLFSTEGIEPNKFLRSLANGKTAYFRIVDSDDHTDVTLKLDNFRDVIEQVSENCNNHFPPTELTENS